MVPNLSCIATVAGLSDNAKLLGTDAKSAALVEQWISFADDEILQFGVQLMLICKGLLPYNKAYEQKLWENLDRSFTYLEAELKKKTFIVGHRVTLADLTLASDIGFVFGHVAGVNFRSKYPNTVRYFNTVTKQPTALKAYSSLTLAEDNVKFVPPKKEEKPKAAPAPKAEKPKAAPKPKAAEPEEEDEAPAAPKPKHPLEALPRATFVLDDWKRKYSNEETREVALPWFWENVNFEEYSLWTVDYKYNDELTLTFMTSNLIGGFFTRLEASRKYLFGCTSVYGESNNSIIKGAFLVRGQEALPAFDVAPDVESYEFTKLDHTKEEDRKFVEDQWSWDKPIEVDGKAYEWADGKVFK